MRTPVRLVGSERPASRPLKPVSTIGVRPIDRSEWTEPSWLDQARVKADSATR